MLVGQDLHRAVQKGHVHQRPDQQIQEGCTGEVAV